MKNGFKVHPNEVSQNGFCPTTSLLGIKCVLTLPLACLVHLRWVQYDFGVTADTGKWLYSPCIHHCNTGITLNQMVLVIQGGGEFLLVEPFKHKTRMYNALALVLVPLNPNAPVFNPA